MSTACATRKALKVFEEGLAGFTEQLAKETAELKRNIDNQPTTGATFYARILADLAQRLEGVGQELQALEDISVGAISLEELVGHSIALYSQNHQQIQHLETALAQYGYRDLYAPLPPECPLDMLELANPGPGLDVADGYGEEGGSGPSADTLLDAPEEQAGVSALEDVTNQLAAAHMSPACAAFPQAYGAEAAAARAHVPPRTTLKAALAPMTAAKALLMRADDTPSSVASPEAMSPSMRALLGKYAASSSSGGSQQPQFTTAGGCPSTTTPPSHCTPPVPAYLSPAFQLAAMEQEVQMAHAQVAVPDAGQPSMTPPGPTWQADVAMYDALTATAAKLAGKSSFLESYRQRFPAIIASTERLLQTVEKQRRPTAAASAVEEEAGGGPQPGGGLPFATAQTGHATQHAQLQQPCVARPVEEDSTAELMLQVLSRADGGSSSTQQAHSARNSRAAALPVPVSSVLADVPAAAAAGVPAQVREGQGREAAPAGVASSEDQDPALSVSSAAPSSTASTVASAAAPAQTAAHPHAVVATAPILQPALPPPAGQQPGKPVVTVPVPALRPVAADEYDRLPSFIRAQLSLDVLNAALAHLHGVASEHSSGFTMEDVEAAGLGKACKVVVNSLVKLGRAQLRVLPGSSSTLYLLV